MASRNRMWNSGAASLLQLEEKFLPTSLGSLFPLLDGEEDPLLQLGSQIGAGAGSEYQGQQSTESHASQKTC